MSIIDFFSETVEANLDKRPTFTRNFVRLGFGLQQARLHVRPNASQLPSQRYVERISLQSIINPMYHPENSALVNLFMPCELLHAMDVHPMCVEGISAFLAGGEIDGVCLKKAEDIGIPDTYCSFHKTTLGAIYAGLFQPPRFILATNTVCDANFTTLNAISKHCDRPRYFVDVPCEENEDALHYVATQLEGMVGFVEDILNRKMNEERLSETIANTNRAVQAHNCFLTAIETRQMPTTATFEMYRLLTSHILMGTSAASTFYEMLANDAAGCPIGSRKRVLWCHVLPFDVEVMRPWFTGNGKYQLLPTDLHYDAMIPLDARRPFESMARRLLANHLNGRVEKRIDAVLSMAKRLHADGVVVFCHWGCKMMGGGSYLIRDALQSEGIPTIVVDGDACDHRNMSEGQFGTRMQAFFELLEGRK